MKIAIDTELKGLGDLLADLLPAGVTPTALRINSKALCLDGQAPLVGSVALTASIKLTKGRARLADFDIEGVSLIHKQVLAALRKKIAGLDADAWRFHVQGERPGSALILTWK
jgi:hypothetical protein